MFNWLPGRGKTAAVSREGAERSRLEQKIEQLEQTIQHLAKETRKQNVVVRELHIHHPVVENVTFRLDALDIEELSGSLNLGNNFDVQFDPSQMFRGGKKGTGNPDDSAKQRASAGSAMRASTEEAVTDEAELRRTTKGYSYRAAPSAPNPDSPHSRKL
jgi:hypothetical protein